MSEEKTGDQNAENKEVEKTTENKSEESTEEKPQEEEKVEEEQEVNPYDEQLKALEEKNKEKEKENQQLETENRQKTGALKEERAKNKELEVTIDEKISELDKKLEEISETGDTYSKKEVEKLLEDKLAVRDVKDKLQILTDDESERKLTFHHYENSIVKSGDVEKDLKMAQALANQHIVDEQKAQEKQNEQNENFMTRFSGGTASHKKGGDSYKKNPALRGAAEALKKLGADEAVKHLNKQT